ncbi:MAG TPA: DMT family transporter, partial [Candidatus Sulfotelmatobacter sp.]|nr:DMT family transporter [Candidatus Sulfotelmatobacter sp.]
MSGQSARLPLWAVAVMVLLCVFWGFNQVAIKIGNGGISPLLQAGLRSIGSLALVWLWSAWRGTPLFRRDGTLFIGLVVGVMFAGEFIFLYWGLVFAGASRSVLFLYMAPFVVAIGAHFFVPGERLRRLQVLGLLAAFAGVAIAFGDAFAVPNGREFFGDILAFIAAVFWGATTVVVKASRLAQISPSKTLFYQLAVSAVLLPVLSLAAGERGITAATPLVLGLLAFQIVVISFMSYLIWFVFMTRYPASTLSAFSLLTPIFGVALGGLVLREPITPALLLASLLVAGGIYL